MFAFRYFVKERTSIICAIQDGIPFDSNDHGDKNLVSEIKEVFFSGFWNFKSVVMYTNFLYCAESSTESGTENGTEQSTLQSQFGHSCVT